MMQHQGDFAKALSAYVAFALTIPEVSDGTISADTSHLLSATELSAIKHLGESLRRLKSYSRTGLSMDEFTVFDDVQDTLLPTPGFTTDTRRLERVNLEQFELAKFVAKKSDEIMHSLEANDELKAKQEFAHLSDRLALQRAQSIHEYGEIHDLGNTSQTHVTGVDANPQQCNPVIFVLIEIYIN